MNSFEQGTPIRAEAQEVPREVTEQENKVVTEAYGHNTPTLIYEDTVAISTSPHFPITVVIKSKEIAESEKQKFDLIWDLIK